jgi:hypothetical protein
VLLLVVSYEFNAETLFPKRFSGFYLTQMAIKVPEILMACPTQNYLEALPRMGRPKISIMGINSN